MDLFCDLNRIAITEARLWWFFNGVCDEGRAKKTRHGDRDSYAVR